MPLLRQKKDQKLPQKEDWLQQPPKSTSQVRPISKNGGIEWYRLKCSVFFGVSWIIIIPLYPMKTSMDKYKTLPKLRRALKKDQSFRRSDRLSTIKAAKRK